MVVAFVSRRCDDSAEFCRLLARSELREVTTVVYVEEAESIPWYVDAGPTLVVEEGGTIDVYAQDDAFRAIGPERREDWISFSSGDLGVEVIYDDRDGRVLTIVRAFFAERSPRAGLGCLYVSSGLGPQQNIRDIARSEKQLKASLESQAEAFRKVLPVLSGPDGPDLLLRCHGR